MRRRGGFPKPNQGQVTDASVQRKDIGCPDIIILRLPVRDDSGQAKGAQAPQSSMARLAGGRPWSKTRGSPVEVGRVEESYGGGALHREKPRKHPCVSP